MNYKKDNGCLNRQDGLNLKNGWWDHVFCSEGTEGNKTREKSTKGTDVAEKWRFGPSGQSAVGWNLGTEAKQTRKKDAVPHSRLREP